jgi:hypothetical protein
MAYLVLSKDDSYKGEEQVLAETHITCHAYTSGQYDYTLTLATFDPEKPDSTFKGRKGKVVWPDTVAVGPVISFSY